MILQETEPVCVNISFSCMPLPIKHHMLPDKQPPMVPIGTHLRALYAVRNGLYNARRINEHSVGELMACALPYHATVEFVRLVQTMPLDKTIWTFLRPMQKSGAPLPRPVLVQRCLNDMVLPFAACRAPCPCNAASIIWRHPLPLAAAHARATLSQMNWREPLPRPTPDACATLPR